MLNILKKYVKTQGEIISQESNGRVGKGSDTKYTLQYTDGQGNKQTARFYGRNSSWEKVSKETCSKFDIYYDPEFPAEIVSEAEYNDYLK